MQLSSVINMDRDQSKSLTLYKGLAPPSSALHVAAQVTSATLYYLQLSDLNQVWTVP